ncbi:aminotransferase class III-fold pyridoxal phosphate-dependent enzyme, partial [Staphylococcus sp. SIMBA_130]
REIGDVRGRGLMIGVEIVDPTKSKSSSGSYPSHPALASLIQRECFNRGLILEVGGRNGSVVRLLPPLIITDEQVTDVLTIIEEAVKVAVESIE